LQLINDNYTNCDTNFFCKNLGLADMDYCNNCIEENCTTHKWFTDLKLKDEDEILLAEFKHIIDYDIIGKIVEKIYLVESHLNYVEDMWIIDFIKGKLNFSVNTPPSAKKGEFYIPISSYTGRDDIINHKIEITVGIIRHNPMSIKVMKSLFDDTILHEIQLIDSNDYLHMESIYDYKEIVELAKSRLNSYIGSFEKEVKKI
jgi:hypothetical protein